DDAAAQVRSLLGVALEDQWNAAALTQSLRLWSDATEAHAIVVIQTARIEVAEMKGFSISEWPYPVVAINGGDWPNPKVFTLLHEVAHLALNLGGLCDLHEEIPESRKAPTPVDEVEHRCNEIAAAVLMPREALLGEDLLRRHDEPDHAWK